MSGIQGSVDRRQCLCIISNMKTLKLISAAAISLVLIGGLSGCSYAAGFVDGVNFSSGGSQKQTGPDANAKSDLANLAYAEEYNLANFGRYDTIENIQANVSRGAESGTGESGGIKFKQSTNVQVFISTDGSSYILVAISETGRVFARESTSAQTSEFSNVTEYQSWTPEVAIEKPVIG